MFRAIAAATALLVLTTPAFASFKLFLKESIYACEDPKDFILYLSIINDETAAAKFEKRKAKAPENLAPYCHALKGNRKFERVTNKSFGRTSLDCLRPEGDNKCYWSITLMEWKMQEAGISN